MNRIISFCIILFLLWISFLIYYMSLIKSYEFNVNSRTDAIVLLENNVQNIDAAIRLLKFRYAPIIFFSFIDNKYINELLSKYNIVASQMIFNSSKDINSIEAIVDFSLKSNITSITLVHSKYRIPKEVSILEQLIPNVNILLYPVDDEKKSYKLFFIESTKYLQFIIMSFLN